MSDDQKPAGKRTLKVLDRSLMPEVLPDPAQARAQTGAGSPRDRVRRRLLQLSEHAAAIAAAASMAACSNSHGAPNMNATGGAGGVSGGGGTAGFGVVDPLPPPAGRGGFGGGGVGGVAGVAGSAGSGGAAGTSVAGTGGTAGFGVVDPMPPPFICPASPADLIDIVSVQWADDALVLSAQPRDPFGSLAEQLTQMQTPAGITATIEQAFSPFRVRYEADSGVFPFAFDSFLGFQCDGMQGVAHYQIGVSITPGLRGITEPMFELITDDADAGM